MNFATLAQEAANDPNGTRDLIVGVIAVSVVIAGLWWLLNKIF